MGYGFQGQGQTGMRAGVTLARISLCHPLYLNVRGQEVGMHAMDAAQSSSDKASHGTLTSSVVRKLR